MAWTLFIMACCLVALHAEGAPTTAVYNFVRCQPRGNNANCVTQQSPQMEWSPDLPIKLPPSTVPFLDAQPVEGEVPLGTTEIETELSQFEDGSGSGSGDFAGPVWSDIIFPNYEQEMGSGNPLTDMERQELERVDSQAFRWLVRRSAGAPPPIEDEILEV
ncbi:serglycin [Corythoichthys intestinalis]|uniref:serglycin n=1 Tax=Corythoichthys intestinalis TaxID=161448 RepID=UPI0025A66F62|nr:serglycin [Corythoichthys intestinalis]XP_061796456.1 serglycin [Nerophis lumbriciformis]